MMEKILTYSLIHLLSTYLLTHSHSLTRNLLNQSMYCSTFIQTWVFRMHFGRIVGIVWQSTNHFHVRYFLHVE